MKKILFILLPCTYLSMHSSQQNELYHSPFEHDLTSPPRTVRIGFERDSATPPTTANSPIRNTDSGTPYNTLLEPTDILLLLQQNNSTRKNVIADLVTNHRQDVFKKFVETETPNKIYSKRVLLLSTLIPMVFFTTSSFILLTSNDENLEENKTAASALAGLGIGTGIALPAFNACFSWNTISQPRE